MAAGPLAGFSAEEMERLRNEYASYDPKKTYAMPSPTGSLTAAPPANPLDRLAQQVIDSDYFRKLSPEAQKVISGTGQIAEIAPPVAAARGGYDIGAGAASGDYGQAVQGALNALPEAGPALKGAAIAAGPILPAVRSALPKGVTTARSVKDAKYVMPDGRLVGYGDQSHEFISDQFGHGPGEEGVERFLKATGAARVNIGANIVAGSNGVSAAGPLTDAQRMAIQRLDVSPDRPIGVSIGGRYFEAGTRKDLRSGLAPAAMPAAKKGLVAYHGSPHDFERFDINKIGTGEGAQAYGHGLYFAENEGVARSYRDSLAAARTTYSHPSYGDLDLTGADKAFAAEARKVAPGLPQMKVDEIATNITEGLRDGDDIAHMRSFVKKSDWDIDEKNAWLAALDRAKEFTVAKPKGHMYEVEIAADPEHFLDWDKPLSEQSEHVQQALANEKIPQHYEGERVHDWFREAGDRGPGAAKELQQRGIPGLRYLDQGSRNAGTGSRNYVVFSDELIKLARKYGIPLGVLGGFGSMGASTDQGPPMPTWWRKPQEDKA